MAMVIAYLGTNPLRGVFYCYSVIFILFVCKFLSNFFLSVYWVFGDSLMRF